MSEPATAFHNQSPWQFSQAIAQNWQDNCVPSGDGCFHPQLGYIPDDGSAKPLKPAEVKALKTFNSLDVDLVECREGQYFDIFCGKAKKEETKLADVEIWIDTSASLRKMDFSKDPTQCQRRTFIEKLQRECGKGKLAVQTYDTSIKTMATLEGVCQSYGSNSVTRLIDWIKASNVEYLLIVTDIDELSSELRNFLDSIGADYHGGDLKDVTVKDLDQYVSIVKKHCK